MQISSDILKGSLLKYQKTTLAEKMAKYFSDIISPNSQNPCTLFITINSAVNTPQPNCFESPPGSCKSFFHFFINKMEQTFLIFLMTHHLLPCVLQFLINSSQCLFLPWKQFLPILDLSQNYRFFQNYWRKLFVSNCNAF